MWQDITSDRGFVYKVKKGIQIPYPFGTPYISRWGLGTIADDVVRRNFRVGWKVAADLSHMIFMQDKGLW